MTALAHITVELALVRGDGRARGRLHTLSRFGAILASDDSLPHGAAIVVTLALPSGAIALDATLVATITGERAARLDLPTGLVVRFASDVVRAHPVLADVIARSELGAVSTQRMDSPTLEGLVAACRGSGAVFSGDVGDLGAATIFTTLARTRKSGTLELELGSDRVTIEFVDGAIAEVRASWENDPRLALFAVLDWAAGTFALRPSPPRGRRQILFSVNSLLLDRLGLDRLQ